MSLLRKINSPQDLKKIPREALPELAKDIRALILETVSEKGGHLGASLGTVELTIALHACFDTPQDRLVWDTGHQAYPHKILTGRRDVFSTLRQYGGISGFLSRNESPYDAFGAGHAGTSISAALGMVEARDQKGNKNHVIAIIGDGSMTAGMAYEALNHAGALKKNFIVILNDNEMSISENVGAFSAYLNRILTGRLYTKVKSETATLIKNIPKIGDSMLKVARRAEESVKGMIVPGLLFEELGFEYFGPIDGHRLDHLITTFDNIKNLSGPILLHVVTKKGKGYAPAEANPAAYHGTPSFHLETGQAKKKAKKGPPSYTSIFAKNLKRLAEDDANIVAITAAMPAGTGLDLFAEAFPSRFYDVGISEQHAVTMAAGMAADGLRPVVAIYSTFLQRAFDQVVHDVALQKLPVVFCLDRAGLVGEDGPTHAGVFDIAYLKGIPNMILMAPKDENELQHMLATALQQKQPVALRYPRGSGVGVSLDEKLQQIPIGKGEIVMGDKESSWDVALLAIGSMVYPAQTAALRLQETGLRVAVINARFIKPLDQALFVSIAKRCQNIVTLEEHVLSGGFGESVAAVLADEKSLGQIPSVSLHRIGLPDTFIEHGPQSRLRADVGLDSEGIFESVQTFMVGRHARADLAAGSNEMKASHVKTM
ncbi:MAG: 1-deoxy-D-xylulose-5-phosphate synthase [Nitrospirae bacterium]|nr:1-deoxy-D-xylulose-5-phosphate synthase [Candidatus Manganitrophaceae bacterium]